MRWRKKHIQLFHYPVSNATDIVLDELSSSKAVRIRDNCVDIRYVLQYFAKLDGYVRPLLVKRYVKDLFWYKRCHKVEVYDGVEAIEMTVKVKEVSIWKKIYNCRKCWEMKQT